MENLLSRITINPAQCGGKPCIRGMRIRVQDVLDLLANKLTYEQVRDELELEIEDIYACIAFASKQISNPVSHEVILV